MSIYTSLTELAEEREAELKQAVVRSVDQKNQAEALSILLESIDDVRESLSKVIVENMGKEVNLGSLDAVKAHLRNELNRVSKPIITAIDSLALDKDKLEKIKRDIEAKNAIALEENFDIQVIRRPKQRLEIANLSDIAFPEALKVTNFEELKEYFVALEECIKKLYDFEIPTPQVTVNPPDINFPEIKIPEQAVNIDLQKVIDALDPLKFLSDRAKKPLAVRLSDGKDFIKSLRTLVDNQEKQMAAFSQGLNESSATKAFRRALDTGVKFAKIDAATSGDNTLVAAVAGKKIRVISLLLVSSGTVNVRFESGASGTALTGQMNLIANTGFSMNWNPGGWFETAAGELLNLELSGATSVDGNLSYVEV